MSETPKTPEQVRAEKLGEIERINRVLNRGVTEVREDDQVLRRDLTSLRERRDELIAETGGGTDGEIAPTSRVRQIRMISSKGY